MKYIIILVYFLCLSGCVHGYNSMYALTRTISSIGSRNIMYQSNKVGLNSNGDNVITINGSKISTGRGGSLGFDNGSYGVGNGAGGHIKTPFGIINGKTISIRHNGSNIRF